jgi:hypothetical protein
VAQRSSSVVDAMARYRTYPQYGDRTSEEVRHVLLAGALRFARRARELPGVQRVALIGSLATSKPFPKDVDVLVTVADETLLRDLAHAGRQLAGAAQQINGGADVFLASPSGEYLGRTCPWRQCGPGIRVRCGASYGSGRSFLRDDFQSVMLSGELIASPPVELWPVTIAHTVVPADVEALLLQPLRTDPVGSSPNKGLQGTPGCP